MKANGPKRKIFDAVDMLTEESSAQVQNQMADGVQMLPLEKIKEGQKVTFEIEEDPHNNGKSRAANVCVVG